MIHLLALFASLVSVSCVLFTVITPDDVRHANQYCSKNGGLSYQLDGNKFVDNKESHCFVKCFLKRIGLINLTSLGIDEEKFNNQNPRTPENYVYFENTLDGSCKPYYYEWIGALRGKGRYWMPSGFYFHEKYKIDFDLKYPLISKPIGSSALEICLIRTKSDNLDEKLCLFSYLRLFDAYGRIDKHGVVNGFNTCSATKLVLEKCVHLGNTFYKRGIEKMASQLGSCLKRNCHSYNNVLSNLIKDSIHF